MAERDRVGRSPETAELRKLRQRIDAVDRRIVELLNERARLALEVGERKTANRQPIRDEEREREVLLRVTMGNSGPLPQADLLALYRRLIASTRRLESDARRRPRVDDDGGDASAPDR